MITNNAYMITYRPILRELLLPKGTHRLTIKIDETVYMEQRQK